MDIYEIMQKAFDGGYRKEECYDTDFPLMVLNPEFWKGLGKSFGWVDTQFKICCGCGLSLELEENCRCGDGCVEFQPGQWAVEWHKFIDHLIAGKDIESFFLNYTD